MWLVPWLLTACVLAVAGAPAAHASGSPTDQVRQYTDQVIKILDDPSLKSTDKRDAIRKVAQDIFDVRETAKRALGRHWQARTPAERDEFARLFQDLLERTYIHQIDAYGGERVRYTGESVDGDFAVVRARLISKRYSSEIPVDAKLLRRDGRWWVYDISVENVSLIGNYRAQFDRIVRTSSYEELVKRLRERRDEFIREQTPRQQPGSPRTS